MAETVPCAGSLVGYEADEYEARPDPATGEILPARTVYRVWVSAPEGAGAPVRVTVSEREFQELSEAGFGSAVEFTVRLGAWRDSITRRLQRIDRLEPAA